VTLFWQLLLTHLAMFWFGYIVRARTGPLPKLRAEQPPRGAEPDPSRTPATGPKAWWRGAHRKDHLRDVSLPKRVAHYMGWWPPPPPQ
jgi:hypothetical protein